MKYDLKLFITNVCNQNCKYCFERNTMKTLGSRINEDVIDDIVRFITNDIDNINSINFLGGETYLNLTDIDILLTKLHELLLDKRTNVTFFTNGNVFNIDVENMYKKFSDLHLEVHITDHNLNLNNEKSNLRKHVEFLQAHNIIFEIRTLFDLQKIQNPDRLNRYFNEIPNTPVNVFLAYYDRNNAITDEIMNKFINWCSNNVASLNINLINELSDSVFKLPRYKDDENSECRSSCDHCGAGVCELVITTDGTLMGCEAFMDSTDLERINVKNIESLEDLRNKSSQFRYLANRYDKEPDKCYTCRYRIICGNCRYNFTSNTDVYSEKPQEVCDFTKMLYFAGIKIAHIFYKELHRRAYKEHVELLDEIIRLESEVFGNE